MFEYVDEVIYAIMAESIVFFLGFLVLFILYFIYHVCHFLVVTVYQSLFKRKPKEVEYKYKRAKNMRKYLNAWWKGDEVKIETVQKGNENTLTKSKQWWNRGDRIENSAWILVIIGALILLYFLFMIRKLFTIDSEEIDFEITAQVGDFLGGLVGSLWALAGFLLFYRALKLQSSQLEHQTAQFDLQKNELTTQREELKKGRQEFEINRITNIIYKQHEVYSTLISEVWVQDGKKNGILEIEKLLIRIKKDLFDGENFQVNKISTENINSLLIFMHSICTPTFQLIVKHMHKTYDILHSFIQHTELSEEDLSNLDHLVWELLDISNILEIMKLSEHISSVYVDPSARTTHYEKLIFAAESIRKLNLKKQQEVLLDFMGSLSKGARSN